MPRRMYRFKTNQDIGYSRCPLQDEDSPIMGSINPTALPYGDPPRC
jgi:hypothetical protein